MALIENAILALRSLGFFQFILPFIMSSAIFYGLLRKSKLFGDPEKNVAVNASIALGAAFFIWAYPILLGVNIETQLAYFMFTGFVGMLSTLVFLILVSMFAGDVLKDFVEKKGRLLPFIGISASIVTFSALVNSGLIALFVQPGAPSIQISETIIASIVLIAMFALAFLIFYLTEKSEGQGVKTQG